MFRECIGVQTVSLPTTTHILVGSGFFQFLARNQVCQRGVMQKTIRSLEGCKAQCAAVAACAYLAWWDEDSKKECVHYSGATCQRTGLSGRRENRLFKKLGLIQGPVPYRPTTGSELRSAVLAYTTDCAYDSDDESTDAETNVREICVCVCRNKCT